MRMLQSSKLLFNPMMSFRSNRVCSKFEERCGYTLESLGFRDSAKELPTIAGGTPPVLLRFMLYSPKSGKVTWVVITIVKLA